MADLDIKQIVKLLNLSSEKRDFVFCMHHVVVETCKELTSLISQSRHENYDNEWRLRRNTSTTTNQIQASRENYDNELRLRRNASANTYQIQASRNNLMHLMGLLERYDSECEKFKNNFLNWEIIRKKNVKCLNDIANSMQKDRKVCNILNVSSNSIAALGGILLFSALLVTPAAPCIVPLAISGYVGTGAGAAASIATSMVDSSSLKKHLTNAQTICEEDKLSFQLLGDCISHTEELEEALNNLIGLDVWMKMWDDLKDFNKEKRELSSESSDLVARIKNCVNVAYIGNTWHTNLSVDAASVVLTTLIARMLFQRRTQSVLIAFKLGLGAIRGVKALVEKLARAAGRSGSRMARLVPQALAKRAVKAVAGIGVALDLTMVVLSSNELAKGEMSEEGKNILSLTELLEDERKVLRDVYDSMV